ncbi:restriction endonuclease subunit S [Thermus filiformis]|uniref:restriction endonuclease subunit S n=1 Tax=Thermus filiformis TaxID=276 RepID=UPI0009E34CCF|nr:restriction endonuclease subunit S [Thermus filiformis]
MAGEWRKVRIEEVAERVAMGPFGSSIRVETFVSEGMPVISGQHLNGWRLDDTVGYNFITREHADRLKRANVQRGDVVFTHRGNIGQVAYIPANSKYERYVISQSQFYLRPDPSKVLPEFIVAYFKTPEGQHKLLANTSQVGVPSIAQPVTYLRKVEIPLPPLPEQRAIAHILGTLDDKIELNRRMSETLEQMARAIFKAWFVDFEPVRAKMEGRWRRGESLPGLPAHLYDLFPDRLVDSELGEIPEGWRVERFGEVLEINPSRRIRKGQVAPYLDMASMPTQGHRPLEVVPRAFSSGSRFINGDTLLARITPSLENGKTAFVDFLQPGEVGWGSTEFIVLRPKPPLPPEFGYCLARHPDFREFAIQSMTGTSGRQRVQPEALALYQLVVPPGTVASAFGRIVQPLFAKAGQAYDESRTLAALRDAILPKLIRGEVRVKDAERFLKERGL